MAKKSSFAKFAGPRFTELVQRSVSEAVAGLDADLKEGSPVATGRFKASWFHAQDRSRVPDLDSVAPDPGLNGKVPPPPTLQPDELDGLANHLVINNLPYASQLCEEGWSKQVAADWFKSIAQRWESGKYLDAAFRNNSTPD